MQLAFTLRMGVQSVESSSTELRPALLKRAPSRLRSRRDRKPPQRTLLKR